MPEPQGLNKVFDAGNAFSLAGETRGMCFAMTCNWIKLASQHGIEGSSKVMETSQLLQTSIVQAGYLQMNKLHTGMTTYGERENLVYSQFGLKKILYTRNFVEVLKKPQYMHNTPWYFEIISPGHSMRFCVDLSQNNNFYLFEPLYSLYRAESAEQAAALVDYLEEAHGEDENSGFNYLILA